MNTARIPAERPSLVALLIADARALAGIVGFAALMAIPFEVVVLFSAFQPGVGR